MRQGRLGPEQLRSVARALAAFHADARCDAEVADHGTEEALARRVRERWAALRAVWPAGLDGGRLAEMEDQQLRLVELLSERIRARADSGRVREGYGGLRLERVFVDAGSHTAWIPPQGDLGSRAADVCADVACLTRQLALNGRRDLAERWVSAYADAAQDYEIYRLLEFYEGIAAPTLAEEIARGGDDEPYPRDVEHRLRAALAVGRAAVPPARILVFGGPQAAGKSTLAERIASELRAPVISARRACDEREVIRRVEAVLDSRRPAVVDGGFRSPVDRAALRAVAAACGVPFLFVECRAEEGLLRRRIQRRVATKELDARLPAAPGESGERWEPVDELPPEAHVVVDTAKHPEGNAALVRRTLGAATRVHPTRTHSHQISAS
jgi:hypothetical protein